MEIDAQVLLRNLVFDFFRQETRRRFHDLDGDPLTRAAVVEVMISATLRDEVIGASIPAAKSIWLEGFRIVPGAVVMVRAVNIEHHAAAGREPITAPFEIFEHASHYGREERVVPPDLENKPFEEAFVSLTNLCACFSVLVHSMCGEHDEHGDRNNRAD